MAVKIELIQEYLSDDGRSPEIVRNADLEYVGFGVPTQNYTNPKGERVLGMVAGLENGGEFFKLFAPQAFTIRGEHKAAFLETAALIQMKTKMIQFEYDGADGEVRPMIEFPICDGTLTRKQFQHCVVALVTLVDRFASVLERAAKDGVIDFAPVEDGIAMEALRAMLETAVRQQAQESASGRRV